MTVISGHQRLKVLKDLKYEDIDCIIVKFDKNKEKLHPKPIYIEKAGEFGIIEN